MRRSLEEGGIWYVSQHDFCLNKHTSSIPCANDMLDFNHQTKGDALPNTMVYACGVIEFIGIDFGMPIWKFFCVVFIVATLLALCWGELLLIFNGTLEIQRH